MTPKDTLPYHQKMNLQEVFNSYEERLGLVEHQIKELFRDKVPFIPLIGDYIISSGGKRLRPLFHLISADLAGYDGFASIEIASIIESIHTASLLHDDVVDTAEVRRGKPSANALWGNQIVVLVGDFLYSNALRAAVMQRNQKIMEALSGATTRMTEGELLQLNRVGDPDITEAEYLDIISAKTGALISAACRVGAILGGLSEEKELALATFGMKIGMVFQMADDILDYMAEEKDLGKKLCKDLEEGKITLPLLLLLAAAEEKDKSEIKGIIKNFTAEGLNKITSLLKKYRSIEASLSKAQGLVDEARNELSLFSDSRAKDALLAIADYSLRREK
ncbi:MAG: polyprenyl synthetase family protein [Nitrospirae bacterium]|nr:polyprenyl synthetase family protein [Nitrospirota bacterium]